MISGIGSLCLWLIEIARRYGMEMNVEQNEGNEGLKAAIP
jgi:hypothetical protein